MLQLVTVDRTMRLAVVANVEGGSHWQLITDRLATYMVNPMSTFVILARAIMLAAIVDHLGSMVMA